jgi:signal transduction histidine kinase
LDLETKGKEDLVQPLDYVLSLAEAGLAEMRALIFELRPDSLEEEGLVAALTKQSSSIEARHNIQVVAKLCDEPKLGLDAKQTLFRIAQEAMNNIVKHAQANRITMRLDESFDNITMQIQDDGIGFNPHGLYPGHLGLHSMRERAEGLGGLMSIESSPGEGTRVVVTIPTSF